MENKPLSYYFSVKGLTELLTFYRKYLILLVLLGFVFAGGLTYAMFGPPKLFKKSEDPTFCASCHLLQRYYDTWRHSGIHRTNKCVDCHLTNENKIEHFIAKGIDGFWDVSRFYLGAFSYDIHLSKGGKKILQQNCVRCHKGIVRDIVKDNRYCWECHRRTVHKLVGAF